MKKTRAGKLKCIQFFPSLFPPTQINERKFQKHSSLLAFLFSIQGHKISRMNLGTKGVLIPYVQFQIHVS